MDAAKVNFNELKGNCKTLNKVLMDNEKDKIKVVGVKKLDLVAKFIETVYALNEEEIELPKAVVDFTNLIVAEDKTEEGGEEGGDDAAGDAEKTAKKPAKPAKLPKEKKPPAEISVFGHRKNTQAGTFYEMLVKGATVEQMVEKAGARTARVKDHIATLINKKGIKIGFDEETKIYKVED